jgi:hypothetical protein
VAIAATSSQYIQGRRASNIRTRGNQRIATSNHLVDDVLSLTCRDVLGEEPFRPTLSTARASCAAPLQLAEGVELLELLEAVDGAGVLEVFESPPVEPFDELSLDVAPLPDVPAESPDDEEAEDEDEDEEPEPLRLSVL